jgi:hypothetical protein
MRVVATVLAGLVALVALSGCPADRQAAGGRPAPAASPPPASPPAAAPVAASPVAAPPGSRPRPSGCPVTAPTAIAPSGNSPGDFFGHGSAYGNGSLWVGGLGDGGVIVARPEFVAADGSVHWKFGWWRGASGALRITGRRLDAPAPPPRAEVPDGYGDSGFQATGMYFPTPGCWEVTGTVGAASLTFVTYVVKPA